MFHSSLQPLPNLERHFVPSGLGFESVRMSVLFKIIQTSLKLSTSSTKNARSNRERWKALLFAVLLLAASPYTYEAFLQAGGQGSRLNRNDRTALSRGHCPRRRQANVPCRLHVNKNQG